MAPQIDDVKVHYVEEVSGRRKQVLFAKCAALLPPIRWPDPFGMVMIEAMACGTPVVAFREGSAAELVTDAYAAAYRKLTASGARDGLRARATRSGAVISARQDLRIRTRPADPTPGPR